VTNAPPGAQVSTEGASEKWRDTSSAVSMCVAPSHVRRCGTGECHRIVLTTIPPRRTDKLHPDSINIDGVRTQGSCMVPHATLDWPMPVVAERTRAYHDVPAILWAHDGRGPQRRCSASGSQSFHTSGRTSGVQCRSLSPELGNVPAASETLPSKAVCPIRPHTLPSGRTMLHLRHRTTHR
jgi:hypothetical protein